MNTQTGFAHVNGTRLYYETAGEPGGAGHPLVLIHAHTFDSRMWDDQVEELGQRWQVLRYDARGYGRSAAPDGPFAHTADLKALLDHVEVESAYVLGLSMGGLIAIDFALAYPESTDALVAADTLLGGYRWKQLGRSIASVHSTGRESGVEAAKDLWLSLDLLGPAMERPNVASRVREIVADYSGWHWLNRAAVRGEEPLAIERLEDITASTLAIVGERDLPDFHVITDALCRRIPGARKVVIPGVGHMANMEDPATFNQTVETFLSSLSP